MEKFKAKAKAEIPRVRTTRTAATTQTFSEGRIAPLRRPSNRHGSRPTYISLLSCVFPLQSESGGGVSIGAERSGLGRVDLARL